MATRSKWAGDCHLCDEEIPVGAPGARFMGKWVHEGCKAARVAEIAAQGSVEVLPTATYVNGKPGPQAMRLKVGHTRGIHKMS